ncbi:MAG: hypothetical protein ABSF35_25090 [Polyangia bacterium]|jgi:hypothetical protein
MDDGRARETVLIGKGGFVWFVCFDLLRPWLILISLLVDFRRLAAVEKPLTFLSNTAHSDPYFWIALEVVDDFEELASVGDEIG